MTSETPENEQVNPEDESQASDDAPAAEAETDSDAAASAEPPPVTPPNEGQEAGEGEGQEDQPADEAVVAEGEGEEGDEPAPVLDIGSEAGPDAEADPDYVPVIRGKIDRFGVAMGTGRRKTSVARVRVKSGDGKLTINGRELEDYVRLERDRQMIQAPLEATESLGKVDIWVRVEGGGTTGQTGAVILGIARALQAMNPSYHHTLAEGGFLTRDGRMVERKKYGFKKARKSFQFSKR